MQGIDPKELDDFITRSLYEDIREGDHTSLACIPSDLIQTGVLKVKDIGTLAGVDFAEAVFKKLDPNCTFTRLIEDGRDVSPGDIAFEITTNAQVLLKGERLVLNVMQRLSGVATMSSRFSVEVEDLPVKILDTRKTTPLMRFLEKWAVRVGGCHNYRDGLYDWIMIKDNHHDAAGGLTKAINRVNDYLKNNNLDLGITVEVRNLVELYEVLEVGNITRIMLDNFEVPIIREAVAIVNGRYETEASGGITLHTVRSYAETGVDFISVGALTHSSGTLDLSLKIKK